MPVPPLSPDDSLPERAGPFAALAGWVLGAALQLQQAALWPAWAYAAMAFPAAALAVALWRRTLEDWPMPRRQLAWCAAAAALAFASTGLRSVAFDAQALSPALEGRDVQVTGVVDDMPQRNEVGLRFTLSVERATLDGQPVQLPPRMDVGWYGGVSAAGGAPLALQRLPADVRAGERWLVTVRLRAPHGSSNPHGFDYELWMWERGVQASGYVRARAADPEPQRLGQTGQAPIALLRQTVRERIATQVEQRQWAGLIAALVVGDQNAIDRVDWDVFRATGVAHLVSISGLHITMFAWAAVAVVGRLWRRSVRLCATVPAPTAALWSGVLLALAYALFAGWGVPAQRTCLMLGAVVALRLSGLRWPWPQTWMLACALVVASDPWALLQAGFWLSFVAVGVLFAAAAAEPSQKGPVPSQSGRVSSPVEPISSQPERVGVQPAHHVAGLAHSAGVGLWALLREQWVMTVALAPLSLLLFGQVSVVGLLANVVAIPWVTLVVTPLAMLGVLLPGVWDWAGSAIGWLMVGLQWLAALPWATLSLPVAPWWLAAAGVLGGVVLVAPLPWHVRGLGLPLLLPVLLWQAPVPPPGQFALMAADVGQGNAVLVRTAHHALLYDAGPRYSQDSDAGHRVIVPLLRALHTRLDTVLISHRDTDHIGGAAAVLAMQPQAQLLSSISSDDPLQTLRTAQRCEAGQQWEWDGVRFAILHPQPGGYMPLAKPNTLSCVLRIESAALPGQAPQVALLVGDIEEPQEAQLIAAGAPLRADVLLVPHHGSKTSSSDAFLDAVQPRQAWVQAGYRNRYGHPAAEVLARYQARGIVVHDSPRCGAMAWASDQPKALQCNRAQGLRYWHHRVP